jgi:hypothetical protein
MDWVAEALGSGAASSDGFAEGGAEKSDGAGPVFARTGNQILTTG